MNNNVNTDTNAGVVKPEVPSGSPELTANPLGIPVLKPCFPSPDDLGILNSYLYGRLPSVAYPAILHFFTDDCRFNSIWTQRKQFLGYLSYLAPKGMKYICTPDFSCFRIHPPAVQIHNIYRSAEIGRLMQANGYKVIPSVTWSDVSSYWYSFLGLPRESVYAIPFRRGDDSRHFWDGLFYFCHRWRPALLLVFCVRSNQTVFHQTFQRINLRFGLKLNYVFLDFHTEVN